MTQVQDLQPMTYIMLVIFAGMAWAGLAMLCLAVYIGVARLRTPKPLDDRWHRDWAGVEKELSK